MKKQNLIYGIALMLIFSLITLISAQSVDLQLCTNSGCYNHDNPNLKSIDKNESLILKIIIIPQGANFICFNGISYGVNVISNNINDNSFGQSHEVGLSGYMYPSQGTNANNFCFSQNSQYTFYLPLRTSDNRWNYNSINPSSRLGSWSISKFRLNLNGLTYYNDVALKNSIYINNQNSEFDSNEITFNVITQEPSSGIHPLNSSTINNIKGWFAVAVFPFIGFLIGAIKDRKHRKIWIILDILVLLATIILWFIL